MPSARSPLGLTRETGRVVTVAGLPVPCSEVGISGRGTHCS